MIETTDYKSAEYKSVVHTRDLGPGQLTEVQAHGQAVGLTNVAQTYYAFGATCPLDGTNLARVGLLEGEHLTCPADDATFDVRTGECLDPEGAPGLLLYSVRVEDNSVKIGPPLD
ncbi:MAG: Rieske (2Fe-2S) protein [Longimicrobiales bacterium]